MSDERVADSELARQRERGVTVVADILAAARADGGWDRLVELAHRVVDAYEELRNERHHLWRGDAVSDAGAHTRARRKVQLSGACEFEGCEAPARDRHHIDGNPRHNARANILLLCRRHHMEVDGRLESFSGNRKGSTMRKAPPRPCVICGRPWKPLRKGRCDRCYSYLYKHGHERPTDL